MQRTCTGWHVQCVYRVHVKHWLSIWIRYHYYRLSCSVLRRFDHVRPRLGASSRHYFLPEAIPTASTAHDELLSSCAANSVFSFDGVRRPCSHFEIKPPKSVLWWMNEWMNEWMNGWMDGWMDGRTDGRTDERTNERYWRVKQHCDINVLYYG